MIIETKTVWMLMVLFPATLLPPNHPTADKWQLMVDKAPYTDSIDCEIARRDTLKNMPVAMYMAGVKVTPENIGDFKAKCTEWQMKE